VELMNDEPARAAMLADEACRIVEDINNNDLIQAAAAHAALALSSLALGDKKRARKSLREARRPMTSLGQSMPLDTMNAAVLLAQAAAELGEPKEAARYVDQAKRIAATVADTGTMGVRLEEVAASLPSVSADPDPAIFTDRELEVLALLPAQLTTREMAEELFLSRNTIKTYLRRIYQKIDATSRDQAIDRARELGVITKIRP
jgi:LuxR family maltose regulon positive regulatory protein